jgi:hypothetical protein
VQVVGRVLGQAQHPPVGEQEVHLGWGLGARCHLELEADAVDDLLLWPRGDLQVTLVDSVRWLFEQGHISRRQAGQLATA